MIFTRVRYRHICRLARQLQKRTGYNMIRKSASSRVLEHLILISD